MTVYRSVGPLVFDPFTTAQRDALNPKERMLLFNITTGQFEVRYEGAWRGLLLLDIAGKITAAHHGELWGNLHPEYAQIAVPEQITAAWVLAEGGSLRGTPGNPPLGELAPPRKTTTGAPTHSAGLGSFCYVAPDDDLYQNNDGGTGWTKIGNGGGGANHNLLSATHLDTLAASVVDGDIVIGNVTPKWSRLAIAVPAANIRNVLGIDNGELRPSWKTALDATNPADIAGAAAPGTAVVFPHRDHVHKHPSGLGADLHHPLGHTLASHTTRLHANLSDDGGLLSLPLGHIMSGIAASRPAAATAGRFYYATDRKVLYRDTGSAWVIANAAVPVSMLYVPGTIPHNQNDLGDAMQVLPDIAFLKNVYARVKTAPIGGTFIIRIVKNGVEIATDFTFAAGVNTASGVLTDVQALFAQNDYWTFNAKAGTAGNLPDNINVQLRPG